ncbi:hypothetical protein [Cellulomonas rhizosphaerae]|uniref:Uncharacterized protein n=1 Tax=Cellulomonas rhizosphaerae TaxID=2293719 RepID=A0A413RPE9_9CELL|nr:hypothetical protein [Cellulomonas rhizosphaerae]RHA43781.1 hypothetical protein D1825_04580 [Cellulomonas rhizosphaerae]
MNDRIPIMTDLDLTEEQRRWIVTDADTAHTQWPSAWKVERSPDAIWFTNGAVNDGGWDWRSVSIAARAFPSWRVELWSPAYLTLTAPPREVEVLDLGAEHGTWTVHSLSATVYRLDLDDRLLRREPGPSSPRGPFDGEFVPLVSVRTVSSEGTQGDEGVIRVGFRHLYLTDPQGGLADYRWWLQQVARRIART